MKNMNRTKRNGLLLCLAGLVVLGALAMTGCAKGTQEVTYSGTVSGVETTFVYTAEGDKVIKQTTESTVPYTALGVTNEDEDREILNPISEQYQGIDGLYESIDYSEDSAFETVRIDYTQVNMEDVLNLPGMSFSGDADTGNISLKQSEALLVEAGYTKVE